MTRLNEIQIDTIQQGKQQLVTDNVPAIPNGEPDLTNTELNNDQKEKIQQLFVKFLLLVNYYYTVCRFASIVCM